MIKRTNNRSIFFNLFCIVGSSSTWLESIPSCQRNSHSTERSFVESWHCSILCIRTATCLWKGLEFLSNKKFRRKVILVDLADCLQSCQNIFSNQICNLFESAKICSRQIWISSHLPKSFLSFSISLMIFINLIA